MFDNERKRYAKEHLWYVEIEVSGTTYRFCENRAPIPANLNAIPTLKSVRVNPAEIDLEGGIGVRAKCSLSLTESADYTTWGTITEPARFWARWRAENPYYLGQRISVFSGYIVNNEFNESNFTRRDYIIESFGQTGAGVSITGKDPLKLASNDRAKAPRESLGVLNTDILANDTSITLTPSGVGSDYPSDGYVRIGDEVMQYTSKSGDTLNGLTRGSYNTQAEEHSQDDTVQLCLHIETQSPSDIDYDLLVNYAGVDPSYINKPEWDAESSNSFVVTYSTLITEPTGVQDLLKELAQSAPHYLYWDERINQIRFSSLRPPPQDAPLITYEGNLIKGKTAVKDKQDMRVSTVICNFGIFDPTKDLDEVSNYRASYVREDSDSVTNYGQRAYKTINSRWISSDNKTAAVLMASRIGRRFSNAPRMLSFQLDAKDADVWSGDPIRISTDLILKQGTNDADVLNYQVISASESMNYDYTALEHTYGDAVDGDNDAENPNTRLVYISGDQDRLKDPDTGAVRTLRDIYNSIYSDISADLDVRFIFENNCVAGSSSNSAYSVLTGAFTELTTPPLIINYGLIVGRGGDADGSGGPALQLQNDIRLNNTNTIGGGGGGGTTQSGPDGQAGGGGGAGYYNGQAASSFSRVGGSVIQAQDGTNKLGGQGGEAGGYFGSSGGNLGQSVSGGTAGKAIDLNGFTITYINTGTIAGDVS